MSRLQPGIIVLDKGLNLQTPKIAAPEGSALDSLNYEQVDFQGQKRIDGYVRYDGQLGSYIDDYYILEEITGEIGEAYVDNNNNVIGIFVSDNTLAVIDYNHLPAGSWGKDVDTVEDHYINVLDYNSVLRDLVGSLPGPVAGLHWFRDRLYAIASVLALRLSNTDQVLINDTLFLNDTDGISGAVVAVNDGVVHLLAMNPEEWSDTGVPVYNQFGDEVGTTDGLTVSTVASIFEARTELQAFAEDADAAFAGWRAAHLGWIVPFENGISLYGSLPSLNQNIQGLGVQGPTSTSGNNGRPLALNQGVNIGGERAQVAGWKSSQTPTSYGLNASDVWEDDEVVAYADAYISWNGTTGQVSAPGATSGTLTQYPANNAVVVEGV